MRVSLRLGAPGGARDMAGRRSHEVGQALVEFALIVIALFLMIIGIFEFGRAVEAYTEISNGAREGARYASVHPGWGGSPDPDDVRDAARGKMVLTREADVSVSGDGKLVTVTVQYGFQPAVPWVWGTLGGGVITLTSSSTMRVEGAPK